jgi:cytochrome c1
VTRGSAVVKSAGCGTCHIIPGIAGARGTVGTPLMTFARRRFIAGQVPNTADNLVRWLRDPQSIEPATDMPPAGLSEQEARDAAAYLYTLSRGPSALTRAAAALRRAAARVGAGAQEMPSPVPGGDPDRGRAELARAPCGTCHFIPGVAGATGTDGPPLTAFGLRAYIAGEVPNTPANLVKWLRAPESVEPHTAMPNLGLGSATARDVAAYLYTLR